MANYRSVLGVANYRSVLGEAVGLRLLRAGVGAAGQTAVAGGDSLLDGARSGAAAGVRRGGGPVVAGGAPPGNAGGRAAALQRDSDRRDASHRHLAPATAGQSDSVLAAAVRFYFAPSREGALPPRHSHGAPDSPVFKCRPFRPTSPLTPLLCCIFISH